jgi:DNA-binding NarL/FixJ family response regulator
MSAPAPSGAPIRVLLADDREMVRTGFRFFLDAQPDITVVAEASDGEEAVASARRERPDVCPLDIRMPKLDGPTLLAEAVRAAAAGDSLVSPSITVRLLRHVTAPQTDTPVQVTPRATPPSSLAEPLAEPLTDSELGVVRLVALGRTNAEIAAERYVSLSTVKTHLSSVQFKLAARNRVEIAAWAWQHGHAQPSA